MNMKNILFIVLTFLVSSGVYSQSLKIGNKAHGGIVAYIDDTGVHGLIVAIEDLGEYTGEEAERTCLGYSFMGKNDWYLPSKYEFNILYENLYKNGLGGFGKGIYWSSTKYHHVKPSSECFSFFLGGGMGNVNSAVHIVRAVRAF